MGGTLSHLRIILCCIQFVLYHYYYVESGLHSVHLLVCDTSLDMIAIEQTSNLDSWHHTVKLHAIFYSNFILDKFVFLNKPVKLVCLQKYAILSVSIYIICITVCSVHYNIVLSFYYDCLLQWGLYCSTYCLQLS